MGHIRIMSVSVQCMRFCILGVLSFCFSFNAFSQTDIYIRGSARLIPIALPDICKEGGGSDANREIPEVLRKDLDLSGYFEVLNPQSYIESPGKCGAPGNITYSDWSVIHAEGVVRGTVSDLGGRVRVQLYLHDVAKQQVILGKEYEGSYADVRMMGHKFANEIMKLFTGEYGPFGTQVAFSTRVGRFKEIAVMDMDGSNIRQLTNDRSLSVSVSWSPAGDKVAFTSYRNRVPDIFTLDIGSRRSQQVTSNPKMELGAKFTGDGNGILTSQSDGSASEIVIMSLNGQIQNRLTQSNGVIDVSPHWSSDRSKVVFCSNRAGGPQIYTMNNDGSDVKRISFTSSNYCTSPSWSPKGDKIAFVCRADAGFQVFVANPDGSDALQLTSYGDNEDPDWAPDGRYLMMSSTLGKGRGFSLALIRSDGSNIRQITSGRGGDFQPAWGPRLD